MPLINLSLKHGQSLAEAKSQLDQAVQQVTTSFRALVQRIEWNPDRTAVTIAGTGFEIKMWVDEQKVHAAGDVPFLASLLGPGLKRILAQAFPKQLPG